MSSERALTRRMGAALGQTSCALQRGQGSIPHGMATPRRALQTAPTAT